MSFGPSKNADSATFGPSATTSPELKELVGEILTYAKQEDSSNSNIVGAIRSIAAPLQGAVRERVNILARKLKTDLYEPSDDDPKRSRFDREACIATLTELGNTLEMVHPDTLLENLNTTRARVRAAFTGVKGVDWDEL